MTKFKQLLLVALAAAGCITACKGPVEKSLTGKSSIPDSVIISDTLARQYVQNYGKHARMLRSGNGSPLPDSRCFWVSLDRLKALVAKLDTEQASGIRFYFATYDSTYNNNAKFPPKQKYWGHNSLVIISTKDSLGNDKIMYNRDYFRNHKVSQAGGNNGVIIMTDPEDRGEICPPPSNCYAQGATLLSQNK